MIRPFVQSSRGSVIEFFGNDPAFIFNIDCDGNVLDKSGKGNHGTLDGTVYAPPLIGGGGGVYFDGINDHVTFATESNFDLERTQPFTLMGVVRLSDNTTNDIYGKANLAAPYRGFQITIVSGQLVLYLISTWNTNVLGIRTNETFNDNTPHFYFLSYDGSSSVAGVKFLKDGLPCTTTTLYDTLSATILNDETPLLGAYNVGAAAGNHFLGYMDETAMLKRVVSVDEYSQYYQWATSTPRKYWFYSSIGYKASYFYRHFLAGRAA